MRNKIIHISCHQNRQVAETNKSGSGGKNRMKKLILLPIVILMVIMMAGMANAEATFNISTGVVISGVYVFNITSTLGGDTDKWINCTFTGSSSSATGFSSGATNTLSLQQAHNSTAFNGDETTNTTNATVDTSALMIDASDWTFTGNCYNDTDGDAADTEAITTVTGIIVDNSNPTCAFNSPLASNGVYAPDQEWSVTCDNATSATIQFGSNTAKGMAESSDVCTYTGDKKAVPQGSYKTLTVIATDGRDTTTCSLSHIRIDIGIPLKEIAAIVASGAEVKRAAAPVSNTNTILIIIFGLAAYWWYRNKKGN